MKHWNSLPWVKIDLFPWQTVVPCCVVCPGFKNALSVNYYNLANNLFSCTKMMLFSVLYFKHNKSNKCFKVQVISMSKVYNRRARGMPTLHLLLKKQTSQFSLVSGSENSLNLKSSLTQNYILSLTNSSLYTIVFIITQNKTRTLVVRPWKPSLRVSLFQSLKTLLFTTSIHFCTVRFWKERISTRVVVDMVVNSLY